MAVIRRICRNHRVLAVSVEFPDLPPFSDEYKELMERLLATSDPLEFGSLTHLINTSSDGRASLRKSKVVHLGPILPDWHYLFYEPAEEGLPPTKKNDFPNVKDLLVDQLGMELLRHDIIIIYYGGQLRQNANAAPHIYEFTQSSFFPIFNVQYQTTIPTVKIGKPVLDAGYTHSVVHELTHALQHLLIEVSEGHAPYLEGEETMPTRQRNQLSTLDSSNFGLIDSYYNRLSPNICGYHVHRFGWMRQSNKKKLQRPFFDRKVILRTLSTTSANFPDGSYKLIRIVNFDKSILPRGFIIEARTQHGYDALIPKSGILIYKQEEMQESDFIGMVPFLMNQIPPIEPGETGEWPNYIFGLNEIFDRHWLHVEVTNQFLDTEGVPIAFEVTLSAT